MKVGATLFFWLAIAVLVMLNDVVADTWIASRLSVRLVEWYKVLVPLPYVILMAVLHARRGGSALLAMLLWPTSTVLVDYLYVRLTFGTPVEAFLDRFAVQWGAPYPILVIALGAAPLLARRTA